MSVTSERLKELIERTGLSYAEIEKVTGISKSSLQRYATGQTKKIPLDVVETLASKFNASARYLLGWEEDPRPQMDSFLFDLDDNPMLSIEEEHRFRNMIGVRFYKEYDVLKKYYITEDQMNIIVSMIESWSGKE